MCLGLYRKAGVTIPENHLRNAYESNRDGAGIAYPDGNGQVIVKKGMWTFEQFMAEYNQLADKPLLVHFRFSTCGKDGIDNCHPFSMCDGKYAMIHNGHISIKLHEDKSDTATFATLVLEPMLNAGLPPAKPALSFLVEQFIGSGNKIAIMDCNGEVTIYNEDKGVWEDNNNVWYSNTGYKYARTIVRFTGGCSIPSQIPIENEHEYNYSPSGKKKSEDGNANGGNVGGQGNTDASKEFSDEIELEIKFCMDELSFTRTQAIDYLIYEGVLEKDDTGKVKESDSNHSIMGM